MEPDSLDLDVRLSLLLNDIESGDFDIVPWHLCKMYDNLDGFAPDLSAEFDKHKSEILREILLAVKDPEILGIEESDLESITGSLKILGITWPEISIIEKSIKSNRLEENDNAEYLENEEIYNIAYEMIDSPHYMSVLDYLIDSGVKNINQYPSLKELLDENMIVFAEGIVEELVKWQDNRAVNNFIVDLKRLGIAVPQPQIQAALTSDLHSITQGFLENLIEDNYANINVVIDSCKVLNKLGVNVSISDIVDIEKNKLAIMKSLLTQLKDGEGQEIQDVYDTVQTLKSLGADWLEFAAIEKSVQSNLKESVDNDEFNWRRSVTLAQFFNREDWFPTDYKLNDTPQDMSVYLNTIKDRVLGYVGREMEWWKRNNKSIVRSMAFFAAVKWALHGELWPELEKILDDNKALIIKMLLTMAKEISIYQDDLGPYWGKPDDVLDDVEYLRPDWPETAIIRRSMNSMNTPLNEVQVPQYFIQEFEKFDPQAFYSFIHGWRDTVDLIPYTDTVIKWADATWKTDHAGNNPAKYAMHRLIDTKQKAHWVAAFRPMLDNHKQDIVTHLLKYIRRGATYYAARDMRPFLIVGVDWPEFDIIKDHLTRMGNDIVVNTVTDLTESSNHHLDYILKYIKQPDLNDSDIVDLVRYTGAKLYHGMIKLEDIKPTIEDLKPRIIKALLSELKAGEDYDDMFYVIGYLRRHIKVNWPELVIILDSINKELDDDL